VTAATIPLPTTNTLQAHYIAERDESEASYYTRIMRCLFCILSSSIEPRSSHPSPCMYSKLLLSTSSTLRMQSCRGTRNQAGSHQVDWQFQGGPPGETRARPVDTGVPQGSPAAPILFATYLSGISDEVESAVPVRGLSFVDDIGWWADGADDEAAAAKLSDATAAFID